jgi:hypothetical protein
MNKILVVVCAVVICFGAVGAKAQTPTVQAYWTGGLVILPECPVGGDDPFGNPMAGEFYVVAHNWNIWMTAIEYSIVYPPQIMFPTDILANDGWLYLGASQVGISISMPTPVSSWSDVLLETVRFIWNCSGCDVTDIEFRLEGHPDSHAYPLIRAADFYENEHFGQGTSLWICFTTPVEETTWGGIKALYE